ncbi:MobA/MobL family protein [Thomasclavelia sp.]|uniref:MobA/MobL family protein n=1 Tax=Thomasclavelia sp. TaxID=3025757 RepID=UPI0025FB534B|nr:MobA/MobL family protein [Thomasclavelia sp.]
MDLELSFIMENRHHFQTTAKCAYIDREDYKDLTENVTYSFSWKKEKKDDLILAETVMPEGTPEEFKDIEKLCASIEQCEANKRFDALISRDCIMNLSNNLVMKDRDGNIDREATAKLLEEDLNDYFRDNFKDYIVHYALHISSGESDEGKNINDNFHMHFVVMANRYDAEKKEWLSKTYRDEKTGKFIYFSELDDKKLSPKKIRELRENMVLLQNRKLKELGHEANVEHQSFRKRNVDKIYTYHLSRFHYNELESLKQKYAYLGDDAKIYEAIMKERNDGATLTRKQRHNLYAELIYNNGGETLSKEKAVSKAMNKSFQNRASGYRAKRTASGVGNATIREISKSVHSTHQAEMEESGRTRSR